MDYDVYEYDEWYWDSIPVDEIYDTAEELDLMDWDEQQVSLRQIIMNKSDIRSELNTALDEYLSNGGKVTLYAPESVKVKRRVKVKPHLFIKPSEPRGVVSMFHRIDERHSTSNWNNW